MRALIVSILVFFAASLAVVAKPLPPFAVALQADGEPAIDTPFEIRVAVSAFSAVPDMVLSVQLPEGARLLSGPGQWQGTLQAGERKEFTLQLVYQRFSQAPLRVRAVQHGAAENYSAQADYLPPQSRRQKAVRPLPGDIRQRHGRQLREVPL